MTTQYHSSLPDGQDDDDVCAGSVSCKIDKQIYSKLGLTDTLPGKISVFTVVFFTFPVRS
jgi:hypothetical protein